MCDELTSCYIRAKEPYDLGIACISGHGRTWELLKLQNQDALWREMDWPKDRNEPVIRWRDEDDAGDRQAILSWFLRRWPAVQQFIAHCLANAVEVRTTKLSGQLALPKATTADLSGCTGLKEVALPKATTAYLTGCTGLKEVALPKATTAYLTGCTGLKEVALPKATWANLRGCTGLKEVALPKATTADLSGCTGLKEVALPKATWANLSGCTARRVEIANG